MNINSYEIDVQESAAAYVVGADIGGTNLRLALADGAGAMLGRWSTSTVRARDAEAVVRLMREGVDTLLREASLPQDVLRAIACGAPGITNVDKGVVIATSYLMGWQDVPLRALLETEFKVPSAVDNDVNLAAVGEQRAGVAQGEANFVFLAIGTGIGAVAGGAAAGAAIGTVAGPVGTAIGMGVGAIAGGLAGKSIAEKIDPTAEDAYWRTTYSSRSYVDKDTPYDIYQSAYRTGYEGFGRYAGQSYEEVEADLRRDYEKTRRTSGLDWNKAKHATRDAWLRLEDRQKQNA